MKNSDTVIKIGESFDALIASADLTKFAAFAQSHTPAETAELVKTMATVTAQIVGDAGGRVVKYLGDSALVVFTGDEADIGLEALLKLRPAVRNAMRSLGSDSELSVNAHWGSVFGVVLPPLDAPDIMGAAVNITFGLYRGGRNRGKMVISSEAFRKLSSETRRSFHRHREPEVDIAE